MVGRGSGPIPRQFGGGPGRESSTQKQAFSALLFLYRDVLQKPLDDLGSIKRAQRERKGPVVLTKDEARRLLAQCEGVP
ncbi:MAG: hypothetical protein M3463_07005 [Verrucomicrobiota bacterium]|nr:hypothetical protein [Verrucomicrobiota bacterium]